MALQAVVPLLNPLECILYLDHETFIFMIALLPMTLGEWLYAAGQGKAGGYDLKHATQSVVTHGCVLA